MMRFLGVVVIGLALVAAGCGPAAILETGGSAGSVAMLPGEVDLAAAADTEYQYEASVEYLMGTFDDGTDEDDLSVIGVGFTWYFMGAVQNDDTAIELQPIDQMASDVSLDIGFGSIDYEAAGVNDSDVFDWVLGVKFILAEGAAEGLGFELDYGVETVDEVAGPTVDQDTTRLRIGALYYIAPVEGLIAKLGYSSSTVETTGVTAEPSVSGIDLGAQYYKEITAGQFIDAELTLGFLSADPDTGADEIDVFRYLLSVDYYPLKFVGFGIDYGNDGYDVPVGDRDVGTFGFHAVWNVEQVPGLDVNIGWTKVTDEVTGSADDEDSRITIGVDYRF